MNYLACDIRIFQSTKSFGSANLPVAIAWVNFAIDRESKTVELLLYNARGRMTVDIFGSGYSGIVMQQYVMRFGSAGKRWDRWDRNGDTQQ